MNHEREKEKILSKTDAIFYVLITLSTFVIGILISQRNVIGLNIIISFPLLGIVFSLIISFIIGVHGMINNSMKNRMLAYCLLISLPIWYTALPVLFYASKYLSTMELQAGAIVLVIILTILTILRASAFVRWFEKKFPILFENEINVWKSISMYIIMFVFLIFVLAFISSLIIVLLLL